MTTQNSSNNTEWGAEKPSEPENDISTYVLSVGADLRSNLGSELAEREDPRAAESSLQEDKTLLVENTLAEIKGSESGLCCDKLCSVVMEDLIRLSNASQITILLTNMKPCFGHLCYNSFGSHVIETMLRRCAKLLYMNEKQRLMTEENEESCVELQNLLLELANQLSTVGEWWPLMYDSCGTHVARSLCAILAGKYPESRQRKQELEKQKNPVTDAIHSNKDLQRCLSSILETISSAKPSDIMDAALNPNSSAFLQVLLRLSNPKKTSWNALVRAALELPEKSDQSDPEEKEDIISRTTPKRDGGNFQQLARDQAGSRFLDVIFENCKNEILSKIFYEHMVGHIALLAVHRVGNYIVQRCLGSIHKRKYIECMQRELAPILPTIVDKGFLGILWKLAEASRRLGDESFQKETSTLIMRAVREGFKQDQSVRALGIAEMLIWGKRGHFRRKDDRSVSAEEEEEEQHEEENANKYEAVHVSIPGTETLKELLQMPTSSNRAALESVACLQTEALSDLARDPVGGKLILETILDGPEDSYSWVQKRVGMRLKGEYAKLAVDKFGHHVVRKLFDVGGNSIQLSIVQELTKAERAVSGSVYGSGLLRHCGADQYKRHPETWKSANDQKALKRKKLEGWLDKDLGTKQKKSKKQKVDTD